MPLPTRARIVMVAQITLFVLLLPLIILVLFFFILYQASLYPLIWCLWLPKGKDVLFISSNSPIWEDYMRDQVFPLVASRAVTLNWSERKHWPRWSLARHFFGLYVGNREFNPLVVVFRPLRRAAFFRFYVPLKARKHGDPDPAESLRRELAEYLGTEVEAAAEP
jgi:hypothetical protein